MNDQDPFFTPSDILSICYRVCVHSIAHQLITVFASDDDIGTNGDVSFSLVVSSNTGDHFEIAELLMWYVSHFNCHNCGTKVAQLCLFHM